MLFNSLTYLVFLVCVVTLFWHLPYRPRLLLILFASLIFYGFWRVEFIPVMLVSVLVDYSVARGMPKAPVDKKKKLLLLSIFINLGLLFYFKYLIFFADNAIGLANFLGADFDPLALNILLPLGISFYTFQTISYTVDVYRGFIKPEKDFVLFACYVTFFPQLVAGPVLRAVEVIHQFVKRPRFSMLDIVSGARRITYGLFLKVVLADNIGPLVDDGFSIPVDTLSALDVWTLAFLFGFQIYFDFSAYSHIALGSALLMGFRFPENFNFPYLATSPKDFWSRWHISLSSWIRDYLYLPLAGIKVQDRSLGGLGNATTDKQKNVSLFATWAIMGLWHGANWTFVVWGVYHFIVIFIYRVLAPLGKRLNENLAAICGTLLTVPVMMLAWIPFRAQSLKDTFGMWGQVVDPFSYNSLGMRENIYLVALIVMIGIVACSWVQNRLVPRVRRNRLFLVLSESLVFVIVIPLVIIFLRPISQFIYFQF